MCGLCGADPSLPQHFRATSLWMLPRGGEVKIRKEGASLRKPTQTAEAASQEALPRRWGAGQVKKIRSVGNQGNRCGRARLRGGSSRDAGTAFPCLPIWRRRKLCKVEGRGAPFLFFFFFFFSQFFSPLTSHDAIKHPLLTSPCMHAECSHCVSAAVLYYI